MGDLRRLSALPHHIFALLLMMAQTYCCALTGNDITQVPSPTYKGCIRNKIKVNASGSTDWLAVELNVNPASPTCNYAPFNFKIRF